MTNKITYKFFTSDEEIVIHLEFDEETFQIIPKDDGARPDWARLGHQKCANCPLGDDVAWCPTALAIADFLPAFKSRFSYEKAIVQVDTDVRTVISKAEFQSGVASLFGLASATSGCPRTRFLRPMARFHLPFSTAQETAFRALSANLLKQYVKNTISGSDAPLTFEQLKKDYAELSVVNSFLAERLRDAVERDAALNAVIILDGFALITPENTGGEFEDIREVFAVG